MKSLKESAFCNWEASRVSKDVHEFLGFIGNCQLLLQHFALFFTLQVPVSDHLKEFTGSVTTKAVWCSDMSARQSNSPPKMSLF